MRWTTNKDQSDYMKMRQLQNRSASLANPTENQAAHILRTESNLKWGRQKVWGCRLFDFWCGHKGVAIEIDGKEHRPDYDAARDTYCDLRSAIIVIRIPNHDWVSLRQAITLAAETKSWKERRKEIGLAARGPGSKKLRRARLEAAGVPVAHGNWRPPESS